MNIQVRDSRPDVLDVEMQYVKRVDYLPSFLIGDEASSPDGHLIETRRVQMHNVRAENPHHDVEGFSIVPHKTKLVDFRDASQIDGFYARELEELVLNETGCSKAITTKVKAPRIAARSKEFGVRATFPAPIAHDDYNFRTGPVFVEEQLKERGDDFSNYKRAAVFSMWRAFSPPPQDVPVCFADARTVAEEDLQYCNMYMGKIPEDKSPGRYGCRYIYSPRHRWCFFRDMTRDEIIFIKVHDTDHTKAWRLPHASFIDPTAGPDAPPRESLDVRVIALWK